MHVIWRERDGIITLAQPPLTANCLPSRSGQVTLSRADTTGICAGTVAANLVDSSQQLLCNFCDLFYTTNGNNLSSGVVTKSPPLPER